MVIQFGICINRLKARRLQRTNISTSIKFMKYPLLLIFIVLAAKSSFASENPLVTGMGFNEARERLISAGWMPVKMHLNDQWQYSGIEKDLFKEHYFEVDSC